MKYFQTSLISALCNVYQLTWVCPNSPHPLPLTVYHISFPYTVLICVNILLGRGGGQRSGAIQEFSGSKMTFDDSD